MKLTLTTDDGTVLGTWERIECPRGEDDRPIRPQGPQDAEDGVNAVLDDVRSDALKLWAQQEADALRKRREDIERVQLQEHAAKYERAKRERRAQLEAQFGADGVWDGDELRAAFEVLGFCAGVCVVRRRSDGALGSVDFDHSPRLYYGWVEDAK